MAITFDTEAELEAFCEAFELRADIQKPLRKKRLKFTEPEYTLTEPELVTWPVENTEPIENLPVAGIAPLEVIPIPEPLDEYPVLLASVS